MLKKDELAFSGSCLNKADPNEPVFVLRAKDVNAAQTVRLWAAMSAGAHEMEKIANAEALAEEMLNWRSAHGFDAPAPPPHPLYSGAITVVSGVAKPKY